ncbi:MAG: hypothetical protein ACUVS9_06300 [Thermaceae bacterium]
MRIPLMITDVARLLVVDDPCIRRILEAVLSIQRDRAGVSGSRADGW